MEVNGKEVVGKVDTGSRRTLITTKLRVQLGVRRKPCAIKLIGGGSIEVLGQCKLHLRKRLLRVIRIFSVDAIEVRSLPCEQELLLEEDVLLKASVYIDSQRGVLYPKISVHAKRTIEVPPRSQAYVEVNHKLGKERLGEFLSVADYLEVNEGLIDDSVKNIPVKNYGTTAVVCITRIGESFSERKLKIEGS